MLLFSFEMEGPKWIVRKFKVINFFSGRITNLIYCEGRGNESWSKSGNIFLARAVPDRSSINTARPGFYDLAHYFMPHRNISWPGPIFRSPVKGKFSNLGPDREIWINYWAYSGLRDACCHKVHEARPWLDRENLRIFLIRVTFWETFRSSH